MDGPDSPRAHITVTERIHLLIDELDLLREKLHRAGATESIYAPILGKVERAFHPAHVAASAPSIKQYLSNDVLTGLAFCSELLPEEEDGISQEDFAEVVSLINELELLLGENSFPAGLTALIRKHIRLAELAIAQYPLRGASALKDAVKYAAGDILFSEAEISDLPPEGAQSLRTLWQRMNTLADRAIKVDNLLQIGSRASKFLDDMMNG